MSGSARSIQGSHFSGMRVASTVFTPEHSKNGKNISAKLQVNAFMNIASRANNGDGRSEVVSFTIWGKLAHTCAKSMSPGKEFHCEAGLNVYDGRVFWQQQPLADATGTAITTKKYGFTIQRLIFGAESNKHIQNEIQAQVRPMNWDRPGSQDHAQWLEILKARQAIQFDPNAPTFGYAKIRMPEGAGIGAFIAGPQPGTAAVPGTFVAQPTMPTTFPATTPVMPAPAIAAAAIVPAVNSQGFVVPGV